LMVMLCLDVPRTSVEGRQGLVGAKQGNTHERFRSNSMGMGRAERGEIDLGDGGTIIQK